MYIYLTLPVNQPAGLALSPGPSHPTCTLRMYIHVQESLVKKYNASKL